MQFTSAILAAIAAMTAAAAPQGGWVNTEVKCGTSSYIQSDDLNKAIDALLAKNGPIPAEMCASMTQDEVEYAIEGTCRIVVRANGSAGCKDPSVVAERAEAIRAQCGTRGGSTANDSSGEFFVIISSTNELPPVPWPSDMGPSPTWPNVN